MRRFVALVCEWLKLIPLEWWYLYACVRVNGCVCEHQYPSASVLCVWWQCLQSNVIYNHFHLIWFVSVTVVAIAITGWSMYRLWLVHIEWFNSVNRNVVWPLDFGIFGFLVIIVDVTRWKPLSHCVTLWLEMFCCCNITEATVFSWNSISANWLLLFAHTIFNFANSFVQFLYAGAAIRFVDNRIHFVANDCQFISLLRT